jgi:hypothetical protein
MTAPSRLLSAGAGAVRHPQSPPVWRAELVFVRTVLIWHYLAFGVTRFRTRSGRYEIVTFGLGPLRLQFIDWGRRWRFQQAGWQS